MTKEERNKLMTWLAEENLLLRKALREAPDVTCDSPEAQAWRAEHAKALRIAGV